MVSFYVKAFIAFVTVNIDEFFILVIFFARSFDHSHSLKPIEVVLGQLIGFTVVLALSVLGGAAGVVIPLNYISLLGVLPLLYGIYELYKVVKYWIYRIPQVKNGKQQNKNSESDSDEEERHNIELNQRIARVKSSTQQTAILSLSETISLNNNTNNNNQGYQSLSTDDIEKLNGSDPYTIDEYANILKNKQLIRDQSESSSNNNHYAEDSETTFKSLSERGFSFDSQDPDNNNNHSHNNNNNYSNSDDDDDLSDIDEEINASYLASAYKLVFTHCLRENVIMISSLMIANSFEEIVVFAPMFATLAAKYTATTNLHTMHEKIGQLILFFYVLIILQCLIAFLLVQHLQYAKMISQYSKNIIPFMLIAIGWYVLQDSVLFE
jgi:cadmium resistance protein CadD (predicted permease)